MIFFLNIYVAARLGRLICRRYNHPSLNVTIINQIKTIFLLDNFFPKLVKRFESEASKLSGEEVHIHEEELQDALRVGREYVEKWEQLEAQILEENRKKGVNEGTTRATGSRRYSSKRHNPEAMAKSKEAAIYLVARKYLSDR